MILGFASIALSPLWPTSPRFCGLHHHTSEDPSASRRLAGCDREAPLLISQGGPTMMARIGVMKALNRHVVRECNPERKDIHWGKRKLKRDQ
jgi:hypothetical protein